MYRNGYSHTNGKNGPKEHGCKGICGDFADPTEFRQDRSRRDTSLLSCLCGGVDADHGVGNGFTNMSGQETILETVAPIIRFG